MSHDRHAVQIQTQRTRFGLKSIGSGAEVEIHSGVAAARLAHSPIFYVPHGHAGGSQFGRVRTQSICGSHCAPRAAMD
jgi:hypothetical protein